jgi:hypothetical protein
MIIRFLQLVLVAIAFTMLSPAPSSAQMGTQPFSFGNGGGSGLGISDAGKAAIVNQKLNGLTPPVLLKDEFGQPLGVVKGPGGVPIVTGPAGNVLPGYRGRGWRESELAMGAGVFNEFFVMGPKSSAPYIAASSSGQTVDAWTGAVYGAPSGYGNSVDQWTAMAYYLGRRD